MSTTAEIREAFATISNKLGELITTAGQSEDPFTALVGHIDQVRGFIDAMAARVEIEPGPQASGLLCSSCIQEARNAEASGHAPLPIHPARTLAAGLAICDVEGRHRIVTPVQHAAAQASKLLLPGQPGQLPPMNGQSR
jgi:hypothetical protein